ncbi:hypothetical protein PAPYR_2718 [Paratrimastix pyriformis]|uniref:Uncharacterized protein n=1 Tax=Paratrimastix pyriformis TaxID=342808 RepID=A0ABQ8UPX4_9EUKA|nr:hypothetical protein PAPYR_2718 [Paratrimastix pyriformis]
MGTNLRTFGGIEPPVPTLGQNFSSLRLDRFHFSCFDVSGQKSFRRTWPTYLATSDALLYVVDVTTQPTRLDESAEEFSRLLGALRPGVPICLCLHKWDRRQGSLSADEFTVSIVQNFTQGAIPRPVGPFMLGSHPLTVLMTATPPRTAPEGMEALVHWLRGVSKSRQPPPGPGAV